MDYNTKVDRVRHDRECITIFVRRFVVMLKYRSKLKFVKINKTPYIIPLETLLETVHK